MAIGKDVTGGDVVWAAAGIVPVGKVAAIGKTATKGVAIWTKSGKLSPVQNALKHAKDHRHEFSEFQNAKQYIEGTKDFLHNSPSGILIKTRINGDILKYNQKTNAFGVIDATGTPRTMFKPTDKINYWNRQK